MALDLLRGLGLTPPTESLPTSWQVQGRTLFGWVHLKITYYTEDSETDWRELALALAGAAAHAGDRACTPWQDICLDIQTR